MRKHSLTFLVPNHRSVAAPAYLFKQSPMLAESISGIQLQLWQDTGYSDSGNGVRQSILLLVGVSL